jgi:gamma-glutamyltranspeptidase / glutathione hydrolase
MKYCGDSAPRCWRWSAVLSSLFLLSSCREPSQASPSARPAESSAQLDPAARRLPPGDPEPPRIALGTRGAVTSAEGHASEVGLDIMRRGGNAVDAAIAVGFALAVTHPSAGNIGGGGFMVVRLADGTLAAIDYREEAPGLATRDMYLDTSGEPTPERLVGPKAAGIPGTVAGLGLAHERFGSLPWADLVMPAVVLARDGHTLDEWHVEDVVRGAKRMREAGFEDSARHYERADGKPFEVGDLWTQPALADTLETIAREGPRAFYEGDLASTMAEEVTKAGGIWQARDLAAYRARERDPIVFDYRGHTIVTMPPPSAGGVVLRQILAAAEALELDQMPWRSVDEVHHYVEASKLTHADRNLLLGDPDFVELPMEQLLSVEYTKRRIADIDPKRATPSEEIGAGLAPGKEESHQTTHFSVVDEAGNAVSNTTTLNLGFGARFVVPNTGVLINNEMDDFAVKPGTANVFGLVQGEQNKIEPGKRMLSSMTPTIVLEGGDLRAIVGSPGGPTITTTVAQIIRAVVDYGLTMDEAVESVRLHHQWLPDKIWTEERIPAQLEAGLQARGHEIVKRPAMGHANCIEIHPETRGFRAVADTSRDGGKAVAY